MLKGKNIVVGVAGGIAAYKIVDLVSQLKKQGANIYVIMTQSAANFVTPLTFREISGQPVVVDMWAETTNWNVEHIALASRADLFLLAPATGNVIGKIANGIADDMLTTTVMATTAPVLFVPAMNTNMYLNPIVQKNISSLIELGYHFMIPESGMLACGVEGIGRLPDSKTILEKVHQLIVVQNDFRGKKILITAGGTKEAIDPVRYIGNRSSGKMGYALASAAAARGATVTLISGPTNLKAACGIKVEYVEAASDMRAAVLAHYNESDIVIKAAAVADYRPQSTAEHKIKKTGDTLQLVLERNPDILLELGQLKKQQMLIGFAAETQQLVLHAQEKLAKKNLDMIIANDVSVPGVGFNADHNIAKVLYRDGRIEELSKMSKEHMANIILDKILAECRK
ncbi:MULTISPECIES: bifunctional phosphopantothenoylcysteine decarboxylase/phosphopantothenate--cysteine ligase CoaBC [Pelosinus]|uniref:Coenzyme A biosynthesis bifunctional protein CoaBC n=1 Tax=Pelosinus fermentans B4 TaxID=1149862 RepID=I9LCE6_9FIRM|nr:MULTISPECIES: bifunctional phosphopantothenoylcysteine decarboxylase/phosphopantothenate--cysteine ligase CoaBC [Pelosinus]EIW18104.1 phosphopantothenoylcysteine decarboxylase/phosphopantothenate/cysteine ligase [Pelosinus fermentans B4]EIW24142.1 phosphopantothenoylcysteine decarboxylase/phosphopantothenate/cysteine ligase [Pelosinus fermentans A11]OAM94163.1 phosphopantothenoylcysteine decarboxylase/phosphopantothenate/cysteine ligase [Pelosinus fermentans DSM 17108]SDR01813.1 phosphopanto